MANCKLSVCLTSNDIVVVLTHEFLKVTMEKREKTPGDERMIFDLNDF